MMNNKNKLFAWGLALVAPLTFSSCNDFLSTIPDNRAEVETPESIRKLLSTAYPTFGYAVVGELSSDNVIENMDGLSYTDPFYSQVYSWQDITESDNDNTLNLWDAYYGAIATANKALEVIEASGNPTSLSAHRGEALMARAFNHFCLVQLFAQSYDPMTNANNLGVVYMTKSETTLKPKYTRASVAEVYAGIERDLEEAMPLIQDNYYTIAPKYHFTKRAAEAFATRYYLFTQQWAKAERYASLVLGSNPAEMLRDYDAITALPGGGRGFNNRAIKWSDHTNKNNLLMLTSASQASEYWGPYFTGTHIGHMSYLHRQEVSPNLGPWGTTIEPKIRVDIYTEPLHKAILPKFPRQLEYTDRAAGLGYRRTTYAEFTGDETLLSRAEARIMQGNYDGALEDMSVYASNYLTQPYEITDDAVTQWNDRYAYHTPTTPSPRKQLNPSWTIDDKQEQYLQMVLYLRRLETLHTGLRWFDIKRYGIEIVRTQIFNGTRPVATSNVLTKRDPRHALQIPQEAILSGLEPNRK